jgi:ferrous iron transport protein A
MNLSMLKIGEKGIIKSIAVKGPLKRRLMDMGILVGTEIKMEKIAPLGDPMEIIVKSYSLSLRRSEAEKIMVEGVR